MEYRQVQISSSIKVCLKAIAMFPWGKLHMFSLSESPPGSSRLQSFSIFFG